MSLFEFLGRGLEQAMNVTSHRKSHIIVTTHRNLSLIERQK